MENLGGPPALLDEIRGMLGIAELLPLKARIWHETAPTAEVLFTLNGYIVLFVS
jgi:hypothetical protein